MKKTCLAMLVLFVFLMLPAMVPAQQPASFYEVQPGDTLWELEGFYQGEPTKWRRLTERNPFLREPGRIFERGGKIIVLIRPGEKLVGLRELGILPNPVPIDSLRTTGFRLHWFWPLIAGFVVVGLVYLLASRIRRRPEEAQVVNPATAGPPFVVLEHGREPELVVHTFDRQAEREAARRDPTGVYAGVRPERIGPVEEGRLTANATVHYMDGSSQQLQLVEQRAYRARYRMPGAEEVILYSLYSCMNPISLFSEDAGFVWRTGEIVAPTPAPVHTATSAAIPAGIVAVVPANLNGATMLHKFVQRVPVTVHLYVDSEGRLAAAVSLVSPSEATPRTEHIAI